MSYIPNANSMTIAGITITGKEIITGKGLLAGATSTCTFVESNGTAGYQVPVGKTLRIIAIRCASNATTGAFYALYSDNDAGYSGTTAHTNPVVISGVNAYTTYGQTATFTYQDILVNFDVPTGKYPGAAASAYSGEVAFIGYLY